MWFRINMSEVEDHTWEGTIRKEMTFGSGETPRNKQNFTSKEARGQQTERLEMKNC